MAALSCKHQNQQRATMGMLLLCIARVLVCSPLGVSAQLPPNPFQLQWTTIGVNNLSAPTSAVGGNFIGPLSPGTPLTVTVTTVNDQPTTEYFSRVKLSWTGAYSDFQPNTSIIYSLACVPFPGMPSPTAGPSYFLWDFAASDIAPFTPSGQAIAFYFQMSGVIGNVIDQAYLLLSVELTDSNHAVTEKTYAIQIGPLSTTPSPTMAPGMNATAKPQVISAANATRNSTNQTVAAPTPSPTTLIKANTTNIVLAPTSNTTVPGPTPTATTKPNTTVPTPSPTAAAKINPLIAPAPTPTATTKPISVTPTPTPTAGVKTNGAAVMCPYQPAASMGNTCFSADGKTMWRCAEPAPQCAQNAVNECLPSQGYPFHNAVTGQNC